MRKMKKVLLLAAILIGVAAIGHTMMMFGRDVKKPAPGEFGLGPRTSARGLYVATLQPAEPLKKRKMLTIPVSIADAKGNAIAGATVTIDGGMPQHGHGLPTKPRVVETANAYAIEGMRFNMGGWWELKLTVTTPAGTDVVTFNVSL
jgi:YtkA-like